MLQVSRVSRDLVRALLLRASPQDIIEAKLLLENQLFRIDNGLKLFVNHDAVVPLRELLQQVKRAEGSQGASKDPVRSFSAGKEE